MPQTEWLQQQELIYLQFWRLEVQGQDAIRVGFLVRPDFLAWGCWEVGGVWREEGRERGDSSVLQQRAFTSSKSVNSKVRAPGLPAGPPSVRRKD